MTRRRGKKERYTPEGLMNDILSGKKVHLPNSRIQFVPSRANNENRIKIKGSNIWVIARSVSGIIEEKINYTSRYFIPTGENGLNIIERIIRNNPVLSVSSGGDDDEADFSRIAKNKTAQGGGSLSDDVVRRAIKNAELPRTAVSLSDAVRIMSESKKLNTLLANKLIKACLSMDSLRKMKSGSATLKSVSVGAHILALANVDILFENAVRIDDRDDRKN